jgi:hypothetical protein
VVGACHGQRWSEPAGAGPAKEVADFAAQGRRASQLHPNRRPVDYLREMLVAAPG